MYKVSRDLSVQDDMNRETVELSFKVLENMYFMSSHFMEKIKSGSDE